MQILTTMLEVAFESDRLHDKGPYGPILPQSRYSILHAAVVDIFPTHLSPTVGAALASKQLLGIS